MDKDKTLAAENDSLQEPAEGDRGIIDRELARADEKAQQDRVKKAMDEAAPQTGVRPGP